MTQTVWIGTKEEHEKMLAGRPVLPPIPRREIEIPSARVVDEPRDEREARAARMADHRQPHPEDQQEEALQRMLDQVGQRAGRNCGDIIREAKVRLTKDRLAVVEEAIRTYQ